MVPSLKSQKFKKEVCYKFYKISKDDLYAAKVLATAPAVRPETVIYHIQQSIEKCIKAVIIFLEKPVLFTHDLEILSNSIPTEYTSQFPPGLGELTQFATIKRYVDGDELIEKNDIQELLKVAEFYQTWCYQIINSK